MNNLPSWNSDEELFALMRSHLFPAVIGDIMDGMGLLHQFLPAEIQPLRADMVVVGRAMPLLVEDIHAGNQQLVQDKPFGLMLEALDDLKKGEVYLASGGSFDYALWGELMSTRAIKLGAAGAVLDGYSRDTPGILDLNFPTFSRGRFAQDQGPRGTVVDFRLPVNVGSVQISPGDLMMGDLDGICVIPRDSEDEVIRQSLTKAMGEKVVQEAITGGMSAVEAFKTYGIM